MTESLANARIFPKLDLSKIDSCFVKETYRDGQKKCIEFAAKAFNEGKRIVILECPTGSGKSTIAMTLANMVKNSFYLTITRILQDQLVNDFDDIVELKGKTAYPCTFYERYGETIVKRKGMSQKDLEDKLMNRVDCSSGYCRSKSNQSIGNSIAKQMCESCFPKNPKSLSNKEITVNRGALLELPMSMEYCACPYYEQVYKSIESPKVVMNFSSFLYQTSLTKRFNDVRDLLIIDEAHNIESQILDFISFSISDQVLQTHGVFIPKLDTALDYSAWFREIDLFATLKEMIELAETRENSKEADEFERISKKLEIFMDHVNKENSDWVVEYNERTERNTTIRTVTLKPVLAVDFVEDLLFQYGRKIVMLSATILDVDVVADSLGINRDEIAAYRMKNRFSVSNRPIFITPVAKMTGGKAKMHEWMPKLIKGVENIISKYPDQKGIIHTHNNAILDAIINQINPKYFNRLLTQRDFPDKRELLKVHAQKKNSILVAPAMHEGIDLRDDLSRFQIICKVPYPNFYENEQLARRINIDPKYYTWLTALKIVQSYGRSIRSETDYADTYIIDEAIVKFLKDAKKILPSWFLEAVIHTSK